MNGKTYMCIDLKSFYASVECVERGLDPLKARLVVADPTRTESTICLAVTPAMKALGIKNRCRVYDIPPDLEYITAPPRMALYIKYSTDIYAIYLKYVAPEDIHVYSIDEVFMDVSHYTDPRGLSPRRLAMTIMEDILKTTGITATCGIGDNLYLAKIALDIISKHAPDHIGVLSEESYREKLWTHLPLTDFWQIGEGTVRRLSRNGLQTMKDIACANEYILYKDFGINAELIIDHAWGRESTTMADIKKYRPKVNSLSCSQVLPRNYSPAECRIIVKEMSENIALELFDKGLTADSASMYIAYDFLSQTPSSKGSIPFGSATDLVSKIRFSCTELYDKIVDRRGSIRRVGITLNNVRSDAAWQYDVFSGSERQEKERALQGCVLGIKKKYGANGIVKCLDLLESARTIERNRQIGGHRA